MAPYACFVVYGKTGKLLTSCKSMSYDFPLERVYVECVF